MLQRILADENLAQAAGDVVAERRIDDRLDHLGRRIGLADPFEPGVGADPHQHRILAAGRLGGDVLNAQNLADDFGDFHGLTVCLEPQLF